MAKFFKTKGEGGAHLPAVTPRTDRSLQGSRPLPRQASAHSQPISRRGEAPTANQRQTRDIASQSARDQRCHQPIKGGGEVNVRVRATVEVVADSVQPNRHANPTDMPTQYAKSNRRAIPTDRHTGNNRPTDKNDRSTNLRQAGVAVEIVVDGIHGINNNQANKQTKNNNGVFAIRTFLFCRERGTIPPVKHQDLIGCCSIYCKICCPVGLELPRRVKFVGCEQLG